MQKGQKIAAYLISSLVGGALMLIGFFALFVGFHLYGAPGVVLAVLVGALGALVLHRRDQWSGHHP